MSAGARQGETARGRLVAAMSEPSFYPHRVRDVELRETGISWVFLAGERVYKVKKPVVLPFLDYGTLERRRLMCEEEVRLNRRLAPSTYLGVRAIRASGGRFVLDGQGGQVVEWAVEMRRLPEERTLERLLRAGRVEPGQMGSLGERLAAFHHEAEQVPDTEGGPGAVKRMVAGNLEELVPLAGMVVDPVRLRAAERFASAWLLARTPQLAKRLGRGLFREGHGDLRMGHVVFHDGIEIFDCVEFDPALRRTDTAADLAFLVMELHREDRPDLADELVSAYQAAGGDPGDAALLSFYAAYRALVRAKLAYLDANALPEDSAGLDHARSEGDRLFALAERFAWRARLPLVLVICGVAASGKTEIARCLARASGLPHLSSDHVRKRLAGLAPHEHAPVKRYSDEFSRRTYRALGRETTEAIRLEGGALVDATFRRRRNREAFREGLGTDLEVGFFAECRAPAAGLLQRAEARARREDSLSDAGPAVVATQLEEFDPLDEIDPRRHVALRTDRTLVEIVDDLHALLDIRM